LVAREAAELERRARSYRGDRPPLAVHGRVVIVVDDGLATGLTELAAVRALRALGALRIVVAVPVAVAPAIELLRAEADDVVCLTVPRELGSVGSWYQDFSPVPDEEVLAALHG
ncbi:MAG TPA: phosphoribosyltransferase family protein, partial [Solirubrobacteraceae bacterium]|nr:phosphoribosyltransferase family protein [Solirubrobacteraceae bacterium]